VLEGKGLAVVVPAHNEETLLQETLAGIPAFVDRIYVVDDASSDATEERGREAAAADARVELIRHEKNRGVGAAIVTGYKRAIEERMDVTCVMAADNQMDPAELVTIVMPVARGEVEYSKANRLFTGQAWELIPKHRYLGNAVLSLLTKIASGYWHVADSQSGYTAVSLKTLRQLDLDRIYPRYGFPNDMLVHLNVVNARVRDVPSRPVYGVVMGLVGLGLGISLIVLRLLGHSITAATGILVALLLIFGSQFTLFAMWFDMESNKDLK
jgi:glycosyltransferase involved in cell wall biosynthesis